MEYYDGISWVPCLNNSQIIKINPAIFENNIKKDENEIKLQPIEDHLDELNNQSTINQTFLKSNQYVTPLEYIFLKMRHYAIYDKSDISIFLIFFQPKYKWNIIPRSNNNKVQNIFHIIFNFFGYLDTENDDIDSYIINTILNYFFQNYKNQSIYLLNRFYSTFDGECVNESYTPIYLLSNSSHLAKLSKSNWDHIFYDKSIINKNCIKETIDWVSYYTILQCSIRSMFPNYKAIKRLVLNGANIFQTHGSNISAFDYLQYLDYRHDENVQIKNFFYLYAKLLSIDKLYKTKDKTYYIQFLGLSHYSTFRNIVLLKTN